MCTSITFFWNDEILVIQFMDDGSAFELLITRISSYLTRLEVASGDDSRGVFARVPVWLVVVAVSVAADVAVSVVKVVLRSDAAAPEGHVVVVDGHIAHIVAVSIKR